MNEIGVSTNPTKTHAIPGESVSVELVVINDTPDVINGDIFTWILKDDPEYQVDNLRALAKNAFNRLRIGYSVDSFSRRLYKVNMQMPEKPGRWIIASELDGIRDAMSQKWIWVIPKPIIPSKHRKLQMLKYEPEICHWLEERRIPFEGVMSSIDTSARLIIPSLDPLISLTTTDALTLQSHLLGGGLVIVLSQNDKIESAFPQIRLSPPIWNAEFFFGLKGHPVLTGLSECFRFYPRKQKIKYALEGLPGSTKYICYGYCDSEGNRLPGIVEFKWLDGTVRWSQMSLLEKSYPASDNYDPVCEQLLLNLLLQ